MWRRAGGSGRDERAGVRGLGSRTDGGPRDRMRRALVLLVAGVWLALAGLALSGAAARASTASIAPIASIIPTDTPTPTTAPATPTNTPTPIASDTPTDTPTATVTDTPTTVPPTATSANNGGGGSGNGGSVGPQPTKVVSQLPSSDSGVGGPLGGLSAGAFGSNGLLLATTSSCIVALLGLLIAAIALVVLLRGGYGPFLKALLSGKRTSSKQGKPGAKGEPAAASANTSSKRYGFGTERDASKAYGGGGWSDPRGGRDDSPRQGSHSRSASRSRDGW